MSSKYFNKVKSKILQESMEKVESFFDAIDYLYNIDNWEISEIHPHGFWVAELKKHHRIKEIKPYGFLTKSKAVEFLQLIKSGIHPENAYQSLKR